MEEGIKPTPWDLRWVWSVEANDHESRFCVLAPKMIINPIGYVPLVPVLGFAISISSDLHARYGHGVERVAHPHLWHDCHMGCVEANCLCNIYATAQVRSTRTHHVLMVSDCKEQYNVDDSSS